jgi:hypothetical protein
VTAVDWAALAVAVTTIVGSFIGSVRWLVKHYLSELKNNGGSSVKDQVERLESRVDQIYLLLCERESK